MANTAIDTKKYIDLAQQAQTKEKISASAVKNLENWLTEPKYAAYVSEIVEHIDQEKWQKLDLSLIHI